MLNRRILRVKAFQNLYAYEQCKASNLNLAKDQLQEAFQPDLNSMEVQDKRALRRDGGLAMDLFLKNLHADGPMTSSHYSGKILEETRKAISFFHASNKKDYEFLAANLISSAERIPQLYLTAVEILMAFGRYVKAENERKEKLSADRKVGVYQDQNLASNKIFAKIGDSNEYGGAVSRNHVNLSELELEIGEWYHSYVKPLEEYQVYIKLTEPSLQDDFNMADAILKKVIFQVDAILNFFGEKDFNWTENKSIVRSLSAKVLKNVLEHYDTEGEVLPEIAINWEDDKEFFRNIFKLSVENDEANKALIAKKTQNWDIERVAQTDKIIISMAITEMKNFPSIPVKVSINEYIDISKTYSTPKSKQFVNGLLDVLAKELTEAGEIRKSGRGLLDNK